MAPILPQNGSHSLHRPNIPNPMRTTSNKISNITVRSKLAPWAIKALIVPAEQGMRYKVRLPPVRC